MSGPKQKVLVVDDNAFLSHRFIGALEDRGLAVTTVDSADAAVDLAGQEQYDIFVLDVEMPWGTYFSPIETAGGARTGVALARRLRSLQPAVPIVAFTISRDPQVLDFFAQGASMSYINRDGVRKPVQLARALRRVLDRGAEPPQIFIVHGRDHASRQELKDFIQSRLKLPEPIILDEQPSRGRTIMEKFEDYAGDADLVFVLLTPDDVGGLAIGASNLKSRVRQNVIFELGYFFGALRRYTGQIILLHKGAIEIPSDLQGIIYISIDNGIASAEDAIRQELADWL